VANFEVDEGDTLRIITKLADNAREALAGIGAFLVSQSQRAFKLQRFGVEEWPARLVPNVPGIVRDLNSGSPPKARRFQDRPALVDTGNLRNSITFQVQPPNAVIVGTSVEYASIHQTGGVTKPIELNPRGRQLLTTLIRTDARLQPLGFLFNKPLVIRNVPSRQFVGLQPGDAQEIETIIAETINGG
jgi:phage gpG-like protein